MMLKQKFQEGEICCSQVALSPSEGGRPPEVATHQHHYCCSFVSIAICIMDVCYTFTKSILIHLVFYYS